MTMLRTSSAPETTAAHSVSALVQSLEQDGFTLVLVGERLRVQPASHLNDVQRQALTERRAAIIAIIQQRDRDAVEWRVQVMREQVVPGRALPFLVARPDVTPGPDACISCGDAVERVPAMGAGRCPACRQAAIVVTSTWRPS